MKHPYNIKIRMTDYRLKMLRRLYDAGDAGCPVQLSEEVPLWRSHLLVETFEDDRRVLKDRVRLTDLGRRYAEAITQPERNTP